METSDIFGLLPTLLEKVGERIVGFDDKIRKKFEEALEIALKPNDELYINKAQVHLAELIGLIVLIMDEPSSINTITIPNYISRDEFRRLYDQTKKDEYLWQVLQEEWNQYKAKDTNNIVKRTYSLLVDKTSGQEEIKHGIEKIIEILEETKNNKGSDKVDNDLTLDDYFKEKLLQKRENHPSFKLMDIDNDLFPDGMITFETEALDSCDQLKSVKDIVAESWNKQERNHLMIEGKGGIGKTVTLLSLPDKLAPHYVPAVYIPLHELKGETNTIEKYIKSQILDYNDNEARFVQLMDSVEKPWNNGPRVLMLLDGFNEIPNERRADICLDIEHWSERPGVQIITSSRYDIRQYVALSSSFSKIELQPLKEEKVETYLKKIRFEVPANPDVTNLITTPLLLTLYIRTEKLRINRKSPLADFRETKNTGLLIWNYLQSELWRYRTQKEEAKACVLAMEFIAPYIAWTMQQHADFVLNEDDFLDRLDKAYALLKANFGNTMELPKHIKTTVKQTSGQLPEYAFVRDLLQEQLSLFNRQERKDANNNTVVEYRLMHQQFRDALAAIHLINSIYLSGDSRPTEWNSTVDHYVMRFVADLISEDEANCLWELNRTSPQLETATRNQLELQRRLHNCDFTKLDFSGLDLSSISLYPYWINNTILKLPTNANNMKEVVLSEKTFSPEGINAAVLSIAITSDGKRIISGFNDKTIHIWDLETGIPIGDPIKGHNGSANAIAITPDGKRIISGSNDNTIRIWDLETGKQIGNPIEGHFGSVNAIAVTTDGKHIISGSGDSTIQIWDLESRTSIGKPIKGHNSQVYALCVTKDNKYIVSGSKDKTIRIWDLETKKPIGDPIEGHKGSVNAVALTPDGKHIVSGSEDKTIRIWDLETRKLIGNPIEGHKGSVNTIAVTPNGKCIVSGSNDKTIQIWDLETRKQIGNSIEGLKGRVNSITVTPDSKRIISGSSNGVICTWDVDSGKPTGKSIEGHKVPVFAVTVTPNGRNIVIGSSDNTIRVLDIKTGTPKMDPVKGHDYAIVAITVTTDGSRIISGSWDKTIRIWDLATGNLIKTIEGHNNLVNSIAVTPDSKYIISGSKDKTIRIWELETGNPIRTIEGHSLSVNTVVVTPDGKHIISGSNDNTIRIWDLETGKQIGKPIEGHEDWVLTIAVTPDSKQIVSGSKDKTIRIWDKATGTPIGSPIKGHKNWVNAVAVTPDGKTIVSGSGDNTIRKWDLETNNQRGNTIKAHKSRVRAVAITPDSKQIISSSEDGSICITEIETNVTQTFRILPLSVVGLDFSKAIISTPELKETLRQNGAIV